MIGLANANSLRMPLASKSIHCAVMSPPYFQLRKYAAGDEQLGGEELHDCLGWARGEPPCGRCFVCNLRAVFAEVWRVLRDDGVAWLNLGSTFESASGNNLGVPWRVALALQADGWVLRSDVIWAKRSAMPESVNGWRWERCRVKVDGIWSRQQVANQQDGHSGHISNRDAPSWTDCPGCATCEPDGGYVLRRGSWRPTSAHEYIFQLVKGMGYYSDREAVKTPHKEEHLGRCDTPFHVGKKEVAGAGRPDGASNTSGMKKPAPGGANLRDVWRLKQANYGGAHYAVFPPSLPETCIKASTSEAGCCPVCGSQWARVVELVGGRTAGRTPERLAEKERQGKVGGASYGSGLAMEDIARTDTLGFRATCDHDAAPVPATVLDPFVGSGTTVMVANALGRRGIGLDLSETYLRENARERTGLAALDTWKNGKPKQAESDLSGLPMFGGQDA